MGVEVGLPLILIAILAFCVWRSNQRPLLILCVVCAILLGNSKIAVDIRQAIFGGIEAADKVTEEVVE